VLIRGGYNLGALCVLLFIKLCIGRCDIMHTLIDPNQHRFASVVITLAYVIHYCKILISKIEVLSNSTIMKSKKFNNTIVQDDKLNISESTKTLQRTNFFIKGAQKDILLLSRKTSSLHKKTGC